MIFVVDTIDEDDLIIYIKERLGIEARTAITMNFDSNGIGKYDEMVSALVSRGSYMYAPNNMDLDFKNRVTPPAKPSIKDLLTLELKVLPSHRCYVFLVYNDILFVMFVTSLLLQKVDA